MKTGIHLEALERELEAQGVALEEGMAGRDATWYCKECKRAIMGMLSRYAPAGTKRVQ